MAIQDDNTILNKGDLKAYHEAIAPMLGGTFMVRTNNSDYYSTDEKVVGVWTDGKPLYQKTFIGNFTPSTEQRVYTQLADLSSLNIDKSTNCNGVVKEQSGYFKFLNVSDKGDAAVYTIAITDDKKLSILTTGTNQQTDYIITLQYTKTTDAANSAVSTPGAYDINFPNTWPTSTEIFFGNGVYGKRFTGSVTATSTWQDVLKQLDTVDRGTSFQFVATGGSIRRRGGDTCMSLGHQDIIEYELWYASNASGQPSGIRLRGKDNGNTLVDYDLWCTYTK